MKSETAFFKDKRAASAKEIIAAYRFFGFTDEEIVAEMKKLLALRVGKNPSPKVSDTLSEVSTAHDLLINSKTSRSVESDELRNADIK